MWQHTACAVVFLRVALGQWLAVHAYHIRREVDDVPSNGSDRFE
jgi:hypothetical protein